MDNANTNNTVNNIHHLMSNKGKNTKNNIALPNFKQIIYEIDEKFKSNSNYEKIINGTDFNSLTKIKQHNNENLNNNMQSSTSNGTVKSILKNKNKMNSSFNLKKIKNINKKNILNNLLNKSGIQSSNEMSDYSYSCFYKKSNESQDNISPINKKNSKNKNVSFFGLKENHEKYKRINSNPNKQKIINKRRVSIRKNSRRVFFSDSKDASKSSSDLSNRSKKNKIKKNIKQKGKYNSALNLVNIKQQKYSIFLNDECNSNRINQTFSRKSSKKKRQINNGSCEKYKRRKIKFNTFIDFKFDKSIFLDIVNKKTSNKFKENIMDIITMNKVRENLKQSIINIDKDALIKEIHDYETSDICNVIEKLPENSLCLNSSNHSENNSNKANYVKEKNIQNLDSKLKNIYYYENYRCIKHKSLIYDSFDDEEDDDLEVYSFYISPNSHLAYIIDSVVLIASFIQVFYLPIFLAYNFDYCRNNFGVNKIMFYCIDIIYIIDLISEFFRSYYNFEEILINKKIEICKNYMNGWFLIDLIEAIPFYIILHIMENDCESNSIYDTKYYSTDFNKLHYVLLIFKILKILKVISKNKILEKVEELFEEIDFFFIYKNVLFTILLLFNSINISACLFIFFGRNSYPGWIVECNLQNDSFINIYITAFYYLITTMTTVGYGDISISSSIIEKSFQIFIVIVGTVFYSWLVTNLSNYIQKNNEKYLDYEQKISVLEEIKISHSKLSNDLYNKILRYLQYNKFNKRNNNEVLINFLPNALKNKLFLEMYKPLIQNFNLLRSVENSNFIVKVVTSFKSGLSIKGDILIQEGDLIEDIFFVKKGKLSLEIGIDMNCEKESIQAHLNDVDINKVKTKINNIKIENKGTKHSFQSIGSNLTNNSNKIYNQKNKTLTEIDIKDDNIKYLKIICIRKNEHFGDVLMFLNERAFFQVKVKSKTAELFYLNKTDAIEVSALYPNIWNKIIKKSLYNMKKIRQIIKNRLIFYSKTNGITLNDKFINNNKLNNNKIKKDSKPKNSLDITGEISPIVNKSIIKNKLKNSEKKNKENNEYSFCEDNNYSESNNYKNMSTEKINELNDFNYYFTLNKNNYVENEKKEKYDTNSNSVNNNLQNKEINNNNNTESNIKNTEEWFENFLHQDRIINCELFPNEKFNENEHLKNNISLGLEKKFFDSEKYINNFEDEKFTKIKKFKTSDLSISHVSNNTIKSCYDNLNEITKYKYYKDLTLREKIKQFLLNEYFAKDTTTSVTNNTISVKNYSKISKINNTTIISTKIIKNTVRKNSKNFDLKSGNNTTNITNSPQLNDSNSKKRSCLSSPKKSKKKVHFDSSKSVRQNKDQKKSSVSKSPNLSRSTKKNHTSNFRLDKFKDIEKTDDKKLKNNYNKPARRTTSLLIRRKTTNYKIKNEKKKISFMDVISQNITENRKTLNNPCEFYAGFFANIIEKQKNVSRNPKKYSKSYKNLNFKEKLMDNNKTDNKIRNNASEVKNN